MIAKGDSVAAVKPFVISRTFDAPRDLMWKVWTEPEHLKWWVPKGYTAGYGKMDFRVGGSYHYSMVDSDGQHMWGKSLYREIVKPEKLVYITTFSDEKGGLGRHPLAPDWPAEMLTTVTFQEQGGKTTVTIEWIPINATEAEVAMFEKGRAGMKQGWTGSLDNLAEFLATMQR